MDPGYLLEHSSNGAQQTEWIAGMPEKRWYGLRLKGRVKLHVLTYRCPRCGVLQSYAIG